MAKGKFQQWLTEDGLLKIENWARHGLTDAELAKNMGISRSTLAEWRKKFPDISDAVKKGREITDILLENALFKRALGYTEENPEIIIETTERDGVKTVHKKQVIKVYPPDTGAAIFLSKNRLKEYYQERPKSALEIESLQLDNELKKFELEQQRRISDKSNIVNYRGIPLNMVGKPFKNIDEDIHRRRYHEFVFPGGRGSTKSSFISLEIIDLIEKNPNFHAVVCRNVAATIKDSVFNQIKWAIDSLGLSDEYTATKSPFEITKNATGQKILFRGADDPTKLKSITLPFGYIAILWLEELDQFKGPEAVRKIEQSVIRGGEEAFIFKSFNPPRSKANWANKYIMQPKESMLVAESCYTDIPEEWLGKPFIDDAEYLREVNPAAYENEYLGVANGAGGNIFENIEAREITDEEIASFDRFYNGVDWGWYPDPFHFIRAAYLPAQQTIYLIDEFRANKLKNDSAAQEVKKRIHKGERVICDSAEMKSIKDFKDQKIKAYPAVKGPGSREIKAKWLASQIKIVYDPKRTPISGEELIAMEYERDRNGEIISGIPDGNDHAFDALGYALEPLIYNKKKGYTFLT